MVQKTINTMQDLLDEAGKDIKFPEFGDTVEGKIVAVTKGGVWLDLGTYGTGLVVGPEVMIPAFRESIEIGGVLSASVIDQEYDNGEILLSLGKATRERSWGRLEELRDSEETIMIKPVDANKGGLLMELEGVRGFLPVSQLTAKNYPRVSDKDEILARLKSFVGKAMEVSVLDANKKENKLIFSEKLAKKDEISGVLKKYEVGSKITCKVSGVADFGIFVNVDDVEGLIHISEISWDKVSDPKKYAKVGDEVDAQVLDVEGDRLSLSMKRLEEDPWKKAISNLKVGSKVKGEVVRVTPFGAFVKLEEGIEALVHISELSEEHVEKPEDVVKVGKDYDFSVLSIDPSSHRLALSLKEKKAKKEVKDKDPKTKDKEEDKKDKKSQTKAESKDKKEKPKKTTKKEKKDE